MYKLIYVIIIIPSSNQISVWTKKGSDKRYNSAVLYDRMCWNHWSRFLPDPLMRQREQKQLIYVWFFSFTSAAVITGTHSVEAIFHLVHTDVVTSWVREFILCCRLMVSDWITLASLMMGSQEQHSILSSPNSLITGNWRTGKELRGDWLS